MQVTSRWAEVLIHICFWINKSDGLMRFFIEPMGNILSSIQYNWVAKFTLPVFLDQFGEIKNLVEFGNPTVIFRIMLSNFRGQVKST